MAHQESQTPEAAFLEAHPELREPIENDPVFQALLARMHCIVIHGETLYLRPSERLGNRQETNAPPLWIGSDDVPKDKEQLIAEYAQLKAHNFLAIEE